jgi:hypothetical protein
MATLRTESKGFPVSAALRTGYKTCHPVITPPSRSHSIADSYAVSENSEYQLASYPAI